MNRKILEEAFDQALVRQRKGRGKMLSYVEASEYVRKLLDGTDGKFSFEIVEHRILDDEVVVLGKLTVGDWFRMAFGGSSITRNRDTGQPVSIADDLKAAATDSVKKAASLYGVGLALYSDCPCDENRNDRQNNTHKTRQPSKNLKGTINGNGRRSTGNGSGGNGGVTDRLTQRQASAIWTLARRAGYGSGDIRDRARQLFDTEVERLSKSEASELISDLMDELGGEPAVTGGG